ncbi:MAG: NTP transferase domain-containing protein, partial [Pseudomonadota bacterium]
MKFGTFPLSEAVGAILAHKTRVDGGVLKKGHLLTDTDMRALAGAGHETVIAARLDDGDVHEDLAASEIAAALGTHGIRAEPAATGRVNLFAIHDGLFTLDRAAIDAANRVDAAITLATLPEYAPVDAGRMVATVKIIPFAAARLSIDAVAAVLRNAQPVVHPYSLKTAHLIATRTPAFKDSVLDKTQRVLEGRLNSLGMRLLGETRVEHRAGAVSEALRAASLEPDILILFGASAIVDEDDVLPSALRDAGGSVAHVGMPVDPGNLLMVGSLDGTPVIGAPGCARSPKENGFDWVLARLAAGLPVTRSEITSMGVGGLLMEIETRPQQRLSVPARPPAKSEETPQMKGVGAIVLAAGLSSRMGAQNKLLMEVDGKPMVRHAIDTALDAGVETVVLVTGHDADKVVKAVGDRKKQLKVVYNDAYTTGLASSLKAGFSAMPDLITGAFILMGDMPLLDAGV